MRIATFLDQSPLFEVYRASRSLEAEMQRILEPVEVTFFEALVLVSILLEEPNPSRPSQLAESFSTSRGNMSNCISSLEARGLLKRTIDQQDTRGIQLTLKPQGRKCAMQSVRIFDRMQNQFERKIGIAHLESTLAAIRQIEQVCEASSAQ